MIGAMRGTTRTLLCVLGQGRGESRNDITRVWCEEGIAGSGRALVCTIPISAWVPQQVTEAGVSLVYRNDDGVDASTLPPMPCPDQRK